MEKTKKCLICGRKIKLFPNSQSQGRKYCSRKCMAEAYKTRPVTWGRKISKAKMGHGWPIGYHTKQSKAQKNRFEWDTVWNKGMMLGKSRWLWKDDFQKYRNLHARISYRFGTPKYCECCRRTDLKMYHWANKSGKYLEVREDWIRLCPKCHAKYDGINKYEEITRT